MTITLINNLTGEYKNAPTGFSWTTLFFGCLPALLRGDWKWSLIQFILASITGGLSLFVMPFFYNKIYVRSLFKRGFLPTDRGQMNFLIGKGYIASYEAECYASKTNKGEF